MAKKFLTDEEALYAAVGRALTSWAVVEDALGQVYCVAMNPRNFFPAERAYWAITSFENRLKMTGQAIEHRGKGLGVLGGWPDISLELQSQNRIRNKLAHGAVVDVGEGGLLSKNKWVLAPYFHARKRPELNERLKRTKIEVGKVSPRPSPFVERPKEKFSKAQLAHFTRGFERAQKQLEAFYFVVERLACAQEGVPLATDPRDQRLVTIVSTLPEIETAPPVQS